MKSESSSLEAPVSVRVLLPNAFQKHTNGAREIQSNAGNLPELLAHSSSKGEDQAQHGCREVAIERRMSTWFFETKS